LSEIIKMAAPKGNKYALGNNGGRPPVFKSPADLEKKINEYFEYCSDSDVIITICGLALYLGFYDRHSLYDYQEKREEFYPIIKRARLTVEEYYESRLSGTTPTGAIFALKNMGWKDTHEIEGDIKGEITIIRKVIDGRNKD